MTRDLAVRPHPTISLASAKDLRETIESSGFDPVGPDARLLKKLASVGRPDLVAKLIRPFQMRAVRRVLDRRPFAKLHASTPGEILLGTSTDTLEDGGDVRLSLQAFTRPFAAFGLTGTGKSTFVTSILAQLIRAGVVVWVYDVEDEYRVLLRLFGRDLVWWARPRDLRLNPFAAINDPRAWIAKLLGVIRSCFYLRDGATTLLTQHLIELYDRRNSAATGDWPTAPEVLRAIRSTRYGATSRKSGHVESAERALISIIDGLGPMVEGGSMKIEPFLSRSVVFDISDLDVQSAEFFVCMMLLVSTEAEAD